MTAAYHEAALRVARTFLFAFLASFIPFLTGLETLPNWEAAKAAAAAAIVAGLAAAAQVIYDILDPNRAPLPRG